MDWQIVGADSFSLHRGAWDALNQSGPGTVLLDSRFVESLLKHFGSGNEILAIAGDPENPVAMAIMSNVKFGVWTSFQPSQAPIGAWLNRTGASIEQLASALASSLPGFPLLVGITQVDPEFVPRPEDTRRMSTLDYIRTARIVIDQPFEDYWQSRGKNLRHNLKRQRNKLEREGIHPRLEMLSRAEDMERAVSNYGELESIGWKNEGGSAIHIDNRQGRFYSEVLNALAVSGQARVYQYFYEDKLVSSDMCVMDRDSLIILKTTYDETIEGSSPAMLMRQDMFQQVFEHESFRRIEFYGKVMDWHTKWSDDIRIMYHINYYPWSLVKTIKEKLGG